MKTAEKWRDEYLSQKSSPSRTLVFRDDSFVKAVQLDAFKEGMRRAAEMCHNSLQSQGPYFKTAILSAIENLKEI